MRKPLKFSLIVLFILMGCLVMSVIVETQTKIIRRTIDNFVYDNRYHYLPCERLPAVADVDRVIQEHQAIIRSIEQVHPGFVGVEVASVCPGKADVVIWYASHTDRVTIESIIDDDTFLGLPYRLQNR